MLAALSLLTALLPGAPWAQTPDAGGLLRQQEQARPQGLQRLPQAGAAQPVPAAPAAPGGPTVRITRVAIGGAEGLGVDAELATLSAGAVGRELDFAALQALADQVSQLLKSRGWLLTRALLPQQDLTDGQLQIVIERGRVEGQRDGSGISVLREPATRLHEQRVARTVAQALFTRVMGAQETPNDADLERAVLLLNDLPGVQVRASLERGATEGSTRLQMQVQEGPLLNGSVSADNYGNRYTGSARMTAQLNLNDPSGHGEQLSTFLTATEGTRSARLGVGLPLGHAGWRGQAALSALRYEIGKDQAAQQSRGTADTASAGLSYAWLRSREANLSLSLNLERRVLRDETLGVNTRDKRVHNATALLSADRQDALGGGGLNNLLLGLSGGRVDLSANATDLANDATSARTQGSFTKLNATLARLQRVNDELSLFASVNTQRADGNLDSSEKFILGGPSGVRAYPSGEGSGDSGHTVSLEARLDLPAWRRLGLGDWQAMAFHDRGHVRLQQQPFGTATNASGRNSYVLRGQGLGLSLSRPGAYTLRLSWSQALGDNPGRSQQSGANSDGLKERQQWWAFALIPFNP